MTKIEMIEEILQAARAISKEKNIKKRENRIRAARVNLIKSSDEQVAALLDEIHEKGAEQVFSKDRYK